MSLREPLTWEELVALEDTGDRWIVDGLIQKGSRMIIYGPPGLGKSLIALDLALSVATGTPFLGEHTPQATGPVLVYSTEGDIMSNRDRLLMIANAHEAPEEIPLSFSQEAVLLDEESEAGSFFRILGRLQPFLLILDPLDSFFWGEENSATATKPIRHFLNRVVQEINPDNGGCAVVLLHHAAALSPEKGSPMKIRGSTAWHGWADTVLQVCLDPRARDRKGLLLNVTKQRNGPSGEFARVTPRIQEAERLISFDVGPAEPFGMLASRIAELLQDQYPLTVAGIRTAVGGHPTTIGAALKHLVKQGRIESAPVSVPSGAGRSRTVTGWQLTGTSMPADDLEQS